VQELLTTDDDDAELDAIRLVLGQGARDELGSLHDERTPQ